MAVMTGQRRAVWHRVSPAAGQVLDLLHARMAEPYAPHLHGEFSIGACTDGVEVIRYRTGRHYAGPGSVVILGPDEPHTGGPDGGDFTYRVMYPAAELLSDGSGQVPWFPEPVVIDPELAAGLRRVHAALCRDTEPLEAETRLSWLLGELVRRHAAVPSAGGGMSWRSTRWCAAVSSGPGRTPRSSSSRRRSASKTSIAAACCPAPARATISRACTRSSSGSSRASTSSSGSTR